MDQLLEQFRPDAMAIEELFFNNNITTGIGVAQARGVLLLAAERHGVPMPDLSQSGEAGGGRIWKGGKAAGHGYDKAAAGIEGGAEAG